MKTFYVFITVIIIESFFPKLSLAISSPSQLTPIHQETLATNPILSWQEVTGASEYRVVVDDEASITSPYLRSIYKTTATYSPELDPGTYYWKVGAKDNTGTWFWSQVWSFTLPSTFTSPTPTPTNTPTPKPFLTPTPSPTRQPTPTNTPTPTKPPQTFIIQSIPSQITSSQSFNVIINIDHATVNTNYFLKGAFVKEESSNYFGKTKVAGNWIENNLTCTSQVSITTDSSGNWTGSLEVITDPDDSGFTGNGDYLFKVGRYGSNCSNLSWSNTANIYVSDDRPPTETNSTSQITPSPTPISTVKPITRLFLLDESIDSATLSSLPKIPLSLLTTSATVAGVSTYSSIFRHNNPTKVESTRVLNPYIIFGTIILLLSGATVIIKKNKNLYEIVKSFNISSWYIQLLHLKKPKNWDKLWHKITKKAQSWHSLVP